MRRICVFFGEMSKEYQRYMFLKQFESLKISSRFHSNFKEYFVFKMKSRDFASKSSDFAFGCFQTLQVKNMKSRDFIFLAMITLKMKSRDFDAKSRDFIILTRKV